jgi:hypothetical protein
MHKYYVSITEAEYYTKSQSFEISIKFIGHDLEKALSNAGVPNLYLGTKKEMEKANDYLKQYIDKNFQIIINDKKLKYTFIGKEINNDDFIYCYLKSEKVVSPKKLEIKNTFLTEVFNEQVNTVYLIVDDSKFNYSFNRGTVSKTHEIID